ncbi:hypothetical protein [Agromyces sp. LHK192]|uniref:amidohydrolase family protein n=1 Tax=Agromyces sp. LHK192 TaxID=2498704 RepID=UPI000FDC399D|nr:hypothetical protein [Agromyces sp. LHK192]
MPLPDADTELDLGPHARPVRRSLNGAHPGEHGVAFPPFIDHHVHLELIATSGLAAHGIAGVVDLGANPAVLARTAAAGGLPRLRYAGQFLTAPGGYPAGRSWLPEGALREIFQVGAPAHPTASLPDAVELAVDEQARFGASVVKVACNADAGPVLDRATIDAVIRAARERGLPVAVHAEGDGMAALAIEAGADVLVHTPWTEELPDELVDRAARAGQAWITTLHLHARDDAGADTDTDTGAFGRAVSNLARFHAAGGTVLYGTDLGNGDLPVGVSAGELDGMVAAGLGASDLVDALVAPWPAASRDDWLLDGLAAFVPGDPPAALADLPSWLATAVILPAEELEPIDR